MTNQKTLNHRDFYTAPDTPMVVNDLFIMKTKPAKITGKTRFGVASPKKTFRLAVNRNRARRLLRDWIAFNKDRFCDNYDYIFIARAKILDCNRETGRKSVCNAIKKMTKKLKNADAAK